MLTWSIIHLVVSRLFVLGTYNHSKSSQFVITAHKRSLSEVIFSQKCVSHSVQSGPLYDVTSCLAAWSHVPSGNFSVHRGLCPGGLCEGCLCERGISVKGGSLCESGQRTPSPNPPPLVTTEVGNTHPTGMNTCYHPQQSCEGYVFAPVCLSTVGVLPQCMLGYHPLGVDTPPP